MKKKIFILFSLFIFIFTSCRTNDYDFKHNTSGFKTIEIVQLELEIDGRLTYTVLCAIKDKESFVKDFSQIPCYLVAPPRGVELGETAIKFSYQDGEAEFFNEYGRTMFCYESEKGEIRGVTGSHRLDEGGYNNLINKYIQAMEYNNVKK